MILMMVDILFVGNQNTYVGVCVCVWVCVVGAGVYV